MPEEPNTDTESTESVPPSEDIYDLPQRSGIWPTLVDVNQTVSILLGRTEVPLHTALHWTEGSLIELDKVSGQPVDVLINGKLCARGEVVTVAENFGVRIVEIVSPEPESP